MYRKYKVIYFSNDIKANLTYKLSVLIIIFGRHCQNGHLLMWPQNSKLEKKALTEEPKIK